MVDVQALKSRLEKPLSVLAFAGALTAALMSVEFNLLESNFYDLRMSKGAQPLPDPRIVLVAVDDPTTKAMDEFSPLALDAHARLMEALESYHPKAVGYLVDMNRVSQEEPDAFQKEWGPRFVAAAEKLQAAGTPVILGTPFDVTGEVLPPYPLSSLHHSIALVHRDENGSTEDKITRRALAYIYERPVFHVDLAQSLGLIPAGSRPRGTFYAPLVDAEYFYFRYHGSPALPHAFHAGADHAADSRELPYPVLSFVDILNKRVDRSAIEGKILLVGTLTREDTNDFALTPYSKNNLINPKLAVHANILDSVIHDQGLVRAPAWVNWLITFALVSFIFWFVLKSSPLRGVFTTLGLAVAFAAVAQVLFSYRGIWLRESQPIVGIFLAYYLVVPYRLIVEYRRRWEYQRKNELLVQVEELKTNFMSLVTHDLKTPVARIQGLAEVLLSKAGERLIDRDKETVSHIIGATDELNRFISSILELSKIESNRLAWQPESKDLNRVVESAVEGFKAQARARRIRLTTHLEPLFPIRIDASLITKTINNLIDNAMKYSPAGSEVRIETRENGDWVVLSVADQGIGMSDQEREQLFTRFYRAKNDATASVGGTGLGLYLTKYFIELHQGRVEVESEQGRGSVFRILLPINASPSLPAPGLVLNPGSDLKLKENAHV